MILISLLQPGKMKHIVVVHQLPQKRDRPPYPAEKAHINFKDGQDNPYQEDKQE